MMNQRIIGLDYGSKTVGVAVSDPLGFTAQGLETITRKDENKLRKTYARIETLIREYEAEKIVLGYPKNMNDTKGERVLKSEGLAQRLTEETGLPVHLWDERLTTVDAHRILSENGRRGKKRKQKVDAVAATLILEGYLGFRRNQKERE